MRETILYTLKLMLPALIPSWRFFYEVAPSPRIEYALSPTAQNKTQKNWQEFRPRPDHLPFTSMLHRMLWNPRWNESLFLVSCAERYMEFPTDHSYHEILNRIKRDLINQKETDLTATPYLQFRLVFVKRENTDIQKDILFESSIHPVTEDIPA